MDPRQSEKARKKYPYPPEIEDYLAAITFGWDFFVLLQTPRTWLRKLLEIHRIKNNIDTEIAKQVSKTPGKDGGGKHYEFGGKKGEESGAPIPISQWHRVFSNKARTEGVTESEWNDIVRQSEAELSGKLH